jgi:dTDP-4-amino-4,6-dideoxygalactose transaminase
MSRVPIHCLDLSRQHQVLKKEIFEAFEKVYDRTAFSGGPFVEEFERKFEAYIRASHVIGVANGTVALHLALEALDIGAGDEVIVPANTFIATAWGVSHAGAQPVFVDCREDTWEIDERQIEALITPRTKAIIGVHLYGQPFDIDAVKSICEKNNLHMIEDAAQAQGARYKGMRAGTTGTLSCYSFYPGKNLGACGEAGGIATNSESLNARLRSLRNHGSVTRYYHDEVGYNYRMGGLEAASLGVKIKYLDEWNARRGEIARQYRGAILNQRVRMQVKPEWAESANHLFVVTTEDRDRFVKYLASHDIIAAFHYPVPCHLQRAYRHLSHSPGDFPNSEYLASHCVSLPMFPELTDEEVQRVIDAINAY